MTSFTDADVAYNPTKYPATGWKSVDAGSSFSFDLNATKAGGGTDPVVTGYTLEGVAGGSVDCPAPVPSGALVGAIDASWVSTTQTFPKTLTSSATTFPFTIEPPSGTAAGFYKRVIKFTTSTGGRGNGTTVCVQGTTPAPSDRTPPDTSITANPANPTNSTAASFSFTGSDNVTPAGSLTFECSLDGGSFAGCSSPKSYSGLANSSHTFQVRAKDAANNLDPTPASFTWTVDTTQPTITFVGPSTSDWHDADVTANWSCSDSSGVVSASVSATTSGEGSARPATGTCTDNAGNTASDTQSFMVDKTAPTVAATPNPAANTNGWNNTDVTVSYSCSDGLSGVDTGASDLADDVVTASGSASGTCVDRAGNSATASYSAQIDKVKPVISGSRTPAANANGWNKTDVVVSFSCMDSGGSGIDANTVTGETLSTEGANQSVTNTGSCTDIAGNTADPATVSGISIDKTAPTVSLVGGPADGGSYYYGFVPAGPTCSASDALSGLDGSCSVSGYGSSVGSHTVTANATDKAGNSASASATYTVLAWTVRGFYQPVDMGSVYNVVKGGSTVPLKFELFAGSAELADVASVKSLTHAQTSCDATVTTDEIETLATGGTVLRYDATAGQYVYNWQTPKQAGKCYRVTMTAQDGSYLWAFFRLK